MNHIVFDFGYGLLCAGVLFIAIWVFLGLCWWLASIKDAQNEAKGQPNANIQNDALPGGRPRQGAEAAMVPRKVIEVVLYDSGREVAPRQSSQRRR